ncbi:NfeD family protein [Pelagibius litoralis]|uniref:NfeD family protein n=1 Tax=Pelagibius litoralis TaxID=374515 RepID=A0A967F1E1_9PROT|nr:NfeD family protein [Pelagibius litoralis]NIA71207.1 NfeD family protein [Pelagibius litoralis]
MISFEQIEYWNWWVIGVFLIGIEVFAPGAVFLWMGIAAGVVGLVLLLVPELMWQMQLLLFAAVSVVSIVAWRFIVRNRPAAQSDQPMLNRRGASYVGRTFTLKEPITDGNGLLHIDDSRWKIEGDDLPAGTKVKVVGIEGTVLQVQRI